MTKKQLEKSYQTVLQDRQKMLGIFYDIREAIGANPPPKKDGIAPETVLNAINRLIKIGSLKPFTQAQLDEWGEAIWDEMSTRGREASLQNPCEECEAGDPCGSCEAGQEFYAAQKKKEGK